MKEYVLTLRCPDRTGLVRTVASWLFEQGCNIIDSDQYGDASTARFFMRVHFDGEVTQSSLESSFADLAKEAQMEWEIWQTDIKPRVLIMVSKADHCLVDLLYRTQNGELPIDINLIVSNHRDTYAHASAHDVDFMHLPLTDQTKSGQEARLIEEVERRDITLIVLARYMQILSPTFCARYPGRIINIHHSFLPSFKGANPYRQAHDRGVKLIGATAHYATPELDEGPIIEQGVERVNHRQGPLNLAAAGRDIERMVLAKAVRYHAEHRVLLNGHKTVVFQ
jgi:formyltetrahydrofolate deformylase